MFCLGALLFWKLSLLSRQLVHLVSLTTASIENLRSVQERVSHSQKLSALGRLAAGATHEISNPLTAILGYSELLADISSLAPEDRESAQAIRKHVHLAQDAVNSLRLTLRSTASQHPILSDRPSDPES
jgi:signal transduction histidine kinase